MHISRIKSWLFFQFVLRKYFLTFQTIFTTIHFAGNFWLSWSINEENPDPFRDLLILTWPTKLSRTTQSAQTEPVVSLLWMRGFVCSHFFRTCKSQHTKHLWLTYTSSTFGVTGKSHLFCCRAWDSTSDVTRCMKPKPSALVF